MEAEQNIIKNIDKTIYLTGKFFPKRVRDDVYSLCGFVGTAESYIGNKATHKKVLALEKSYESAVSDNAFDAIAHKWDDLDTRVVKHIVRLQHKYKFEKVWVEGFFRSMKMDMLKKKPSSLEDLRDYIYGSAEVIGLMFAKILDLPQESYEAVQAQARVIKWVDILRSLDEDTEQERHYFPTKEVRKYGLSDLTEDTAQEHIKEFEKFIGAQVKMYYKWQKEADDAMAFVPERYQIPIRTTIDIYSWILKEIEANPMVVYEKKLKPRKRQIIRQIIKNSARGTARVTVRTTKQVRSGVKKVRPVTKAVIPKIKNVPSVTKEKAKELKDKYIELDD